jgi:Putative DNA-binding domain
VEEPLFEIFIRKSEGDTLDFKEQYPFVGESDDVKGELLKDVLAFANAWKETDAYILVGVKEKDRRADGLVGVSTHLVDNDLQEFVNKKTNRPVTFSVEALNFGGIELDAIRIDQSQSRPIFLTKNFGKLRSGVVYIRRGSSTDFADPNEIAEMGKAAAASGSLLPSTSFEVTAFARAEDSRRTGLIGRVYIQLTNSDDRRSARDIAVTIRHDETGCMANSPFEDWQQSRSDGRLNPWVLRYSHSLNPKQSTSIIGIPLCDRSPLPFNISAELTAADCCPLIFTAEMKAEQIANGERITFQKTRA